MKRRGGVRAVCLLLHWCAVKGITPPPPPTPIYPPARPPPATSHTSHGVTHFFLSSEHLGSAQPHTACSLLLCVWASVCPSANSALSFKQICPDCPRTKLTSLPTASQTHFAGQTGKVFSSLYSTSQFTQQI